MLTAPYMFNDAKPWPPRRDITVVPSPTIPQTRTTTRENETAHIRLQWEYLYWCTYTLPFTCFRAVPQYGLYITERTQQYRLECSKHYRPSKPDHKNVDRQRQQRRFLTRFDWREKLVLLQSTENTLKFTWTDLHETQDEERLEREETPSLHCSWRNPFALTEEPLSRAARLSSTLNKTHARIMYRPFPHNWHISLFFFFPLKKKIVSNFLPFLSQFGSQIHPHFSNHPVLLALDSLHTPRPWRPQIGSGDPWETYAFFKPHALDRLPWFQAPEVLEMQRSKSSPAESPPPPPSEWWANYVLQCEPVKLSPWQRRDSKTPSLGVTQLTFCFCSHWTHHTQYKQNGGKHKWADQS